MAREAVQITGNAKLVLGVDPSAGMVAQARKSLPVEVTLGIAEQLPVASDFFDFLSMGYALRHLSDLTPAFCEFQRVLKPGGQYVLKAFFNGKAVGKQINFTAKDRGVVELKEPLKLDEGTETK